MKQARKCGEGLAQRTSYRMARNLPACQASGKRGKVVSCQTTFKDASSSEDGWLC